MINFQYHYGDRNKDVWSVVELGKHAFWMKYDVDPRNPSFGIICIGGQLLCSYLDHELIKREWKVTDNGSKDKVVYTHSDDRDSLVIVQHQITNDSLYYFPELIPGQNRPIQSGCGIVTGIDLEPLVSVKMIVGND